jgi:hypothetical protein
MESKKSTIEFDNLHSPVRGSVIAAARLPTCGASAIMDWVWGFAK